MTKVKVGDSVKVVNNGQATTGKVAAVKPNGELDVVLPDGKVLTSLEHASGGQANGWHSQNTDETLAVAQSDPAVIEIN